MEQDLGLLFNNVISILLFLESHLLQCISHKTSMVGPSMSDRKTPENAGAKSLTLKQSPCIFVDRCEDQTKTDELFRRPLRFVGVCSHLARQHLHV